MKIAIIGGGYTGLSAAYYLSKKKCEVVLFEKEEYLGGLAGGFKTNGWQWPLDKYYHHIFTSDKSIIGLAKEVGCNFIFIRPKTSIYYRKKISSFDSALDLLAFSYIPFIERVRTGVVILSLKVFKNWKLLEGISASKFIRKTSGQKSWKTIWQPLFEGKFDKAAGKIPASWFWSRIAKRGQVFLYPKGGFDALTGAIVKASKKRHVRFILNSEVKSVSTRGSKILIGTKKGNFSDFDKVICTLPFDTFTKIVPSLPGDYVKKLNQFEFRGTVNLILSLKKQFLNDGTYWLNVNDKTFPFVGVVEQTNFIPDHRYNSDHIIHIVNYLAPNHPYFKADNKYLIANFLPYLQRINPEFNKSWIKGAWLFKSKFAQPIITMNYSKIVPGHTTPLNNVFLGNMQQVYPWDRQTNYAVELGKKLSTLVTKAS